MKKLVCEMCGGADLVKQDGVFVCQNCGTKYSVEEARKMMMEGSVSIEGTVSVEGTVKVDKSEELKNLPCVDIHKSCIHSGCARSPSTHQNEPRCRCL